MNSKKKFPLRVVPWFADDCTTFLCNMLKWLPNFLNYRLSVLEFGGGNSTLFFLAKGLRVISIESDKGYVDFISSVAHNSGFSVCVFNDLNEYLHTNLEYDLSLIYSKQIDDVVDVIDKINACFIVNDGISRLEVLNKIVSVKSNSVIILDNVEYSANWGRLDRSSGKPDLVKAYRSFLRSSEWKCHIFEQQEGRGGFGAADKTGWESPHRWMSAVCWPSDHFLTDLIISNIGFPVVNKMGLNDLDLETLSDRCPFNWETMEWQCQPFPEKLDLKLYRNFD